MLSIAASQPWSGWRPAVCWPDCFCEAPRAAWIRQPADSWSNLAYLAVAAAILWQARSLRGRSGRLGDDPRPTAFFGALCALLGAGSFFFHASLTFAGEWLDVMGMHLAVGYLALYSLRRARLLPGGVAPWLAALSAASALVLSVDSLQALRLPFFVAIILALVGSEARRLAERGGAASPRLFAWALAQFLAALGLWLLDKTKAACAPESALQGHAVWHVLCATALGTLYWHFRSEMSAADSGARPGLASTQNVLSGT